MEKQIGSDISQVKINTLSKIKGQPQVVDLLRVNIDAYFQSRASNNSESNVFGPILLTGPSGTGKSMLGLAIHSELGNLKLIEINGEMLSSTSEIYKILIDADSYTTIFIDESHGMSSKTQHILLTAISERKLYIPRYRAKDKAYSIPLAPFVLILATTHEYHLQAALRNRIRIYCRLKYYSLEDLTNIVRQRADALRWGYESAEVLKTIAQRAKKTPRLALNVNLTMCWNVAQSKGRNIITLTDVEEAFKHLQIDELGLDSLERSYLTLLMEHGDLHLNVISSKLGLPSHTISRVVEPYLLQENLIHKGTGSIRCLSEKGRQHLESTRM